MSVADDSLPLIRKALPLELKIVLYRIDLAIWCSKSPINQSGYETVYITPAANNGYQEYQAIIMPVSEQKRYEVDRKTYHKYMRRNTTVK